MQVGHEKSLTALLPALAGANLIFGMGMIELAVTFSFTQLIIDDMIVSEVRNLISRDRGAGELQMPALLHDPGMHLASPDRWQPQRPRQRASSFTVHSYRPSKQDIAVEARQRVKTILSLHEPAPLPPPVRNRIREIIQEEEDRKASYRTAGRYGA
ncbi:MAG: hypothetical protein U0411_06900 [Thermodesulfovibrionales bacterium]